MKKEVKAPTPVASIDAFVIYSTYRVEGKTAYVYHYGRQRDGKTFMTRNACKPYFYVQKKDEEQAKQIAAIITTQKSDRKNFEDEKLAKAVLEDPRDIPATRDALESANIPTYEADVRFTYRFMMDNNIQGNCAILGNPQQHAFVDCFYDQPEFAASTWIPDNLKILSIDIETGEWGKKLYCVSLAGSDGYRKTLVVSDTEVQGDGIATYYTEKACLEALMGELRHYDPDIITGWSVIDFDLFTIQKLCAEYSVPFIFGRGDERCKIKLDKQYFRESTADVQGRMVLDGIMLMKVSFIKLEDYKLDTAASEVLGEQKLITVTGLEKVREIDSLYAKDKPKLAAYCLKDAELVLRILQKKQLIELTVQRSLLTGMQLDRVKASIASLDNVYLRELAKRGYAARSHTYQEKEIGITGGYVMSSQPGIYDYVIVCDFKSLYPSIMRTLNIDPLSYVPGKRLKESTKEFVVAENGAVFTNTNGVLPDILERLHKARDEARAQKNTVAVGAIKVLMNSFFGSLASPQCRFFSMEMANAITVTGQSIIKHTTELIREKGYTVIYGDTDSIFIDLNVNDLAEAERIGKEIQDYINVYYKEWTPKHYHRDSKLELQFDKTFVRFFLPLTRGGEGSKKRYAGLRMGKDGKETIDFTGLEFVRRDWTELAKEFQLALLDKVFHKQEVTEYVKQFVADVRAGKMDALLIYKKALRKGLSEYTKTTPQHVKAARKMERVGSNIIEYYVTTDGPQPTESRTAPIDYEHYIQKQLKPIADAALVFYNTNLDDLIAGSTQKNLFQF